MTAIKPSLPFGSTEWSTDWSTVSGQNHMSWGTWEAPAPAPIAAKTATLKVITPILPPPAPIPGPAFAPVGLNSKEGWNPVAQKPVSPPVVQPPVIAPSSFVDVSHDSAWTVPPAPPVEEDPRPHAPLSSPQRSIKLRQAGGNIETELRHQDLYKTEYCRSWRETGLCRYGTKCQFAHGDNELRPVLRHPKYKTEVCRNFSDTGTCPYGTRCRFVHYQRGRSSNVGLPPDAEVGAATSEMSNLAIEASASPPVPEEAKEKVKGSRLPFFQKLRRNTSGDKEKDKESNKLR